MGKNKEVRLARVATGRKGKKIEADLDAPGFTIRSVLVDRVDMSPGVDASSEDDCIFYHNSDYVECSASIDAEVVKEGKKTVLKLTPNPKYATNDR